jgi:hypothetical protein
MVEYLEDFELLSTKCIISIFRIWKNLKFKLQIQCMNSFIFLQEIYQNVLYDILKFIEHLF